MTTLRRSHLKIQTFGAYDLQKLRMQMGLRIVANFRAKLKEELGDDEPEIDPATGEPVLSPTGELSERAEKLILRLKASYRTLTEGVARHRTLPDESKFTGDPLISEYTELVLVHQFLEIEKAEKAQFRQLEYTLNAIPIYVEYLSHVAGIGPAMAAVLITYLDVHKAEYPSQFHAYAGLDVAEDGFGRSRRAEHLVERDYIDKNGRPAKRMGLTYNDWLKSRLLGALAPSFMRAKGSIYREVYDNYKHRITTDPARSHIALAEYKKLYRTDPDAARRVFTPGRFHRMALRYMVKQFLTDLWTKWRELEGLPVVPSYHEAKMRHIHKGRRPPPHEDAAE